MAAGMGTLNAQMVAPAASASWMSEGVTGPTPACSTVTPTAPLARLLTASRTYRRPAQARVNSRSKHNNKHVLQE
eukprot:7630315-Pyramimonas_sp.AAC.1